MADQEQDKNTKVTVTFDPKTKEIAVNKIQSYAGFKKDR